MTRSRVELAFAISTINNWANMPDRDTISGLTEKQAAEAVRKLKEFWEVVDRRAKR